MTTNKHLVLSALAAVSIAACSASADEAQVTGDDANVTAASWPSLGDDRACNVTPAISTGRYAGNVARLRFFEKGKRAALELYDKMGRMTDSSLFNVKQADNKIVLVTSGTSITTEHFAVTRTKSSSGRVTTSLKALTTQFASTIGNAAEIPVSCDVDPGAPALKHPMLAAVEATKPQAIASGTALPAAPDGGACLAAGLIGSGVHKGRILRIAMAKVEFAKTPVHATVSVYDARTGQQVDAFSAAIAKTDGQAYRIFSTSSAGLESEIARLAPALVDGANVLVFTTVGARSIASEIAGNVPIRCDFIGK